LDKILLIFVALNPSNMVTISNYDFNNKRALVRVDFNVPLNKETNKVSDDTRIRAALPTIKHILANGGSVVLMSHFGRPKNGPEAQFSLHQIVYKIEELVGQPILFCDDCVGVNAEKMAETLKPGEILL
jgi:phosphoglycerate kinase